MTTASTTPLDRWGNVGLGAMPLSTAGRPGRVQAIETIHAALDAGVRHIDTADAYCLDARETGHNETLIADALASWDGPKHDVLVATKGGHVRDASGGWHTDGRPQHLHDAARRSRDRLGVERIGLYYFHRPDPAVPFRASVEAIAELLADGVVERVGVSNVDVDQLEVALELAPIAAVQNEYSPFERTSAPVLRECERRSIAFVAWAPLGGAHRAAALGDDVVTRDRARLASELGVSVARLILRELLDESPNMFVIPGARRAESIVDAHAAGLISPAPRRDRGTT